MVLDAGGGTVDWTVHECILRGRGGGQGGPRAGAQGCRSHAAGSDVGCGADAMEQTVLSEAVHAVGEMLGSTLLDRAFMTHLREEVGSEVGILSPPWFPSLDTWIVHPLFHYSCCHACQVYEKWARAHPQEVLLVLNQWEALKCLFGGTDHSSGEG